MRVAFLLTVAAALLTSRAGAQQTATPSNAQRANARQLWDRSIIIVSHTHINPGPNSNATDPARIAKSLDEFRAAGVTAAVMDLTIDDGDWLEYGWKCIPQDDISWGARFAARLNAVTAYASDARNKTIIAHSAEDIRVAKRKHLFAVIVGSEGSNQLESGAFPSSIVYYHNKGWLVSQLYHTEGLQSDDDPRRCYCNVKHRFHQGVNGGVTDEGLSTIRAMQDRGVLIDLTHVGAGSAAKILDSLDPAKPVLLSHDLPDRVDPILARILSSGGGRGVVGLHFFYAHSLPILIDRIVALRNNPAIGITHLALAPDYFPGIARESWAVPSASAIRDELLPALIARGLSDDELKMLLGWNLLRLFDAAWISN